MKLSEIFQQLTHGELSQVSLGGADVGQISEDNHNVVMSHVNLGLTALHKRFHLKEGRMTVVLQAGVQQYVLPDDLLKVEQVFMDSGVEISLNDSGDPLSCTTPKPQLLRVPLDVVNQNPTLPLYYKTAKLELIYRQNHEVIPVTDFGLGDPTQIEVDLPYSHLEALLLFVASRVHAPGDLSGQFNASNNYMAKYERACKELEETNLRVDQGGQMNRLGRNGWV